MNKLEFICRQLSRAEKKTFEHYVVTRIWHLLNDNNLKFITQQYVARPKGRALTDMYFPQLQKHIEIDEGHHKKQIQSDKIREADIINATGHEVLRVDVTQSIEVINSTIDDIINKIKTAKNDNADFNPWDFEAEQNPATYISRGYIDLNDDIAFRTMVDAANCFGNTYKPKGIWTGGAKHPKDGRKFIWFPKLYKNGKWDNSISNDENTITEICLDEKIAQSHIQKVIRDVHISRIVFARVKSPLGDIMYRFKGEYELDLAETNANNGAVFKRTNEQVKTYSAL
jgi:very-short-patch-repair endonuclease